MFKSDEISLCIVNFTCRKKIVPFGGMCEIAAME
jgi:hypothetical protein